MAKANLDFNDEIGEGVDFSFNTRAEFWDWFRNNRDDVIMSVGWWVIKFEIAVKDLKPFFEKIFGQNPYA